MNQIHELEEIEQKGGIDSEVVNRMLRCHFMYALEATGAWVRFALRETNVAVVPQRPVPS